MSDSRSIAPRPNSTLRGQAGSKRRSDKSIFKGGGFKRVLHVGSGAKTPQRLHTLFGLGWKEIRVDIDPQVKPHFVSSMTDMSHCVPDRSVDAIWSSHSVEHLHSFEVPVAFKEFARILKPDGFLLVNCPDIEQIAEAILKSDFDRPVYRSPAGPITPLDMIFGHQKSIRAGNDYMSHRTAFTQKMMGKLLVNAGFAEVRTRRGSNFDMWCLAIMGEVQVSKLLSVLLEANLDFHETATG